MDDEVGPLDVDLVFSDLHDFLKTYPPSYWKKQDSDTPLRTVKTVLHAMVKVRGDAILDHLTRINDPHGSELVAYLRKLVNNGVGKENQEATANNGTSNDIMKNGNNRFVLFFYFPKIQPLLPDVSRLYVYYLPNVFPFLLNMQNGIY